MKSSYTLMDLERETITKNVDVSVYEKIIDNYNSNLSIIRKIQQSLLNQINEYRKNGQSVSIDVLNDLVASLSNMICIDQKIKLMNSFEEEYHCQYKSLKDILKELHPNLSATDIEYCTYFKLKLSAKEISNLRNISHHSVCVIKNRIKKKIGVDTIESLFEYLNSLV